MRPSIEKPENHNRRLEPTGRAKSGKTRGLTGQWMGLAHQDTAGQVFGWVWNWTEPLLQPNPGPLAGFPDSLLTLLLIALDWTLPACLTYAFQKALKTLRSTLQWCSHVHYWGCSQCRFSLYTPKYTQSTLPSTPQSAFSSTLPGMLSRMLQVALDGTLPVCFTICTQNISQDASIYRLSTLPSILWSTLWRTLQCTLESTLQRILQSTLQSTPLSLGSTTLPIKLSRTLPVALDGPPSACLTMHSEVSSQGAPKPTLSMISSTHLSALPRTHQVRSQVHTNYTAKYTLSTVPSKHRVCCQVHSKYAARYTQSTLPSTHRVRCQVHTKYAAKVTLSTLPSTHYVCCQVHTA